MLIHTTEVREEMQHQKLSFSEIAKTVGQKWQVLAPEEKESFERKATTIKDNYTTLVAQYKQTESYKEYDRYLADFKVKNVTPQTGIIQRPG